MFAVYISTEAGTQLACSTNGVLLQPSAAALTTPAYDSALGSNIYITEHLMLSWLQSLCCRHDNHIVCNIAIVLYDRYVYIL